VRTRLHLRVAAGHVRAHAVRRGRQVWAGEASFQSPAELSEVIAELAGEARLGKRPWVGVTLEPPLVQLRTLRDLPPVRRAELRKLVASQARRFFRANGKPLVTDACWTASRWKRPGGDAIAAAVEEPWLDAIADGADAAGLRLEAMGPEFNRRGTKLELLSAALRTRDRAKAAARLRRLGWTTLVFWAIAMTLTGSRMARESRRIDRELAQLREPAAALLALRQQLDEATGMVQTIEQARHDRSAVLERLTRMLLALPDSAYLTSLSLDAQGNGSATGGALQGARVVAAWDRDGIAIGPRLSGPAVRETVAGRERERFTITFGSKKAR
jgi:hypothetical protein